MITLLRDSTNLHQALDFAVLLAKHGYSAAGYQAVVQEAVATMVAQLPPPAQTEYARNQLLAEVQNLLLRTAFTRLAPTALVLEQLKKYLAADQPLAAAEVTVFLLEQLGPLHEAGFYHSAALPMLVEIF